MAVVKAPEASPAVGFLVLELEFLPMNGRQLRYQLNSNYCSDLGAKGERCVLVREAGRGSPFPYHFRRLHPSGKSFNPFTAARI